MNASQRALERWGKCAPLPLEGITVVPTKAELDQSLADFLRREDEADRNGFTKKALHSAMTSLDSRFADHERKDDDRHNAVVAMCRGLEARMLQNESDTRALKSDVSELKPAVRETMDSVHDITERELEEQRASNKEMKGRVWQIAIAVLICILCGVVGAALGKLGLSKVGSARKTLGSAVAQR